MVAVSNRSSILNTVRNRTVRALSATDLWAGIKPDRSMRPHAEQFRGKAGRRIVGQQPCVRMCPRDEQRFALAGIERERLGLGDKGGIGLRRGFRCA
jgi:hypothetical protein